METIKNFFNFLTFTLHENGSRVVYGGSLGGATTSKAVGVGGDMALSWLFPYVPLIGICIAFLKLTFDFFKWKHERASNG